ncbi:ABC transporter ATP-binding protein [Konateibacter massiliensis]|uniref:ABC transporter ATP-binding protein n=1 Tax=Konateibacter massiliensis TaxID=2002841 RepID=UPI000C14E161|nr:ABC transporter ATP-binding protein [Konateibacter massiliensis]
MPILEIKNLNVTYNGKKGKHSIIKDVSFRVSKGECLCVLGESGSGKSVTMKAVMGLLDNNFDISGSAFLEGRNLMEQDAEALRKMRGSDLTMILQNPMTCFDSLYRIDYQMAETFLAHTNWSKEEIYQKSVEILEKMKIKEPGEVLRKYPHQLSGGMLQRIMIGIALTLNPKILIADEPTTAIDAITQFEIMDELKRLKNQHTTMIFITHDLGIASMIADTVIVMNGGKIVDNGTFSEILQSPKDEYTRLLIEKRSAVMNVYKKVLGGDLV